MEVPPAISLVGHAGLQMMGAALVNTQGGSIWERLSVIVRLPVITQQLGHQQFPEDPNRSAR